jgi:hypothetical protein
LKDLGFERLSLFHPSMITTPTNRYGVSQAIVLAVMPYLDRLLVASLNQLRSISAERLGVAVAKNLFTTCGDNTVDVLHWKDFIALNSLD